MICKIESPEEFFVREIIDKKFLRKFNRKAGGIEDMKGPYTLFLLKKRNLTTAQAIGIIAKHLRIKEQQIGYAGLKDKFAVTEQYVTIKNVNVDEIKKEGIELRKVGYTDKMISVGDLIGNEFEITLHNVIATQKSIEKGIDNILKNGMPNYFGPQRFGKNKNNYIVGRYLLKREFDKALKVIYENCDKNFIEISHVPKKLLKFFIHSYQSWIFNETLKIYLSKCKTPYFGDLPVFGYSTRLGNSGFDAILKDLARKERIAQKDFMISELKICCTGSKRKAFIKLTGINYEIRGILKMRFALPKGCYATTLLNEMKL